ncbi:MAG: hypothetical protein RL274_287 [Pseudomonadota bacterium]|jgi:hypothetical protein
MSADLKDYRAARKAFIAACEAVGVDAIARVHPMRGDDGKPLFLDAAALGPRLARRALMVLAHDLPGSAVLTGLMREKVTPSGDARLVLVHAPDPAAFAGMTGDGPWLLASLSAVATEDLSKVTKPRVLNLNGGGINLAAALPGATILALPAKDIAAARDKILAELAAL